MYKLVENRVPNYYIDPKDVKPWLNYLKEEVYDVAYYRIALFMILTGCRIGEAAGLCWNEVYLNVKKPYVEIVGSRIWRTKPGEKKIRKKVKTNSSVRTINLPEVLVTELKKIKKLVIEGEEPVFYRKGAKLLSVEGVSTHFNSAFKHLGLPWSGCHIARHTCGTIALMAGKNLAVVQAMLGHSNISQTQQYAKVVALQDNSAPQQTADFLGL